MVEKLLHVNPSSGVPIYVQVMEQIKHAVEICALMPGDQLPGIRTLAQQLVVSPNTIVKAYTELEYEGVIDVRHGSGAFIIDQERTPRQHRRTCASYLRARRSPPPAYRRGPR